MCFKDSIKEFEGYVKQMKAHTSTLLNTWVGEGRNQFQTQYTLMERQLDDISDVLYEIYEALVDAQSAYIDADEAVAKQISASMAE
jgi:WXG100 family type VII secretion target